MLKNACLLLPGGQRLCGAQAACQPALNYILRGIALKNERCELKIHLIGQQVVAPKRLPMATRDQIVCYVANLYSNQAFGEGTERLRVVTFFDFKGLLLVFKSRYRPQHFCFCLLSSLSLCCLLLPTTGAQYTVAEAKKKTIVFFWLSHFYSSISVLSHSKSERLMHLDCWRRRFFFFFILLFAHHWEVVFQTRDYAHCDLPKHTVLAIFS